MEAILGDIVASQKPASLQKSNNHGSDAFVQAMLRLARALEEALPLLQGEQQQLPSAQLPTAQWLLDLVQTVPSELGAETLARAVYDASLLDEDAAQQAALMDALGFSDQAMTVMMEVGPRLAEIRTMNPSQFDAANNNNTNNINNNTETFVDIEEETRIHLRREAEDAAQLVAIAKAELGIDPNGTNKNSTTNTTVTHTVQRKSTQKMHKNLAKLERKADAARQKALDAGAILDVETDLLPVNFEHMNLGEGGLMQATPAELQALQDALLPEGSRVHYDEQGFPTGTIRETEEGLERVIIPPPQIDPSDLHERLRIADVIEPPMARIFAGTESLNPMQSAVFETAYKYRDNMLVCAPTGAGKTNVALLTVAAHFRDVGLLGHGGRDGGGSMDVGPKVIYIAPMKALAQEVVEKFSARLKPLRLVVRELTGDMQLTRAQAAAAHVIVTTPEKWDVVTRKSGTTDETSLGNQCGLLILDEVHLLADDRGAVIESIVSRLHRRVEATQRQTRIVALSATLPNYQDVADFLQVNSNRGLSFFGPEHRPVPLVQQFIGVGTPGSRDRWAREAKMNEVCFDVVEDSLQRGYQVMVFVHSRKGTGDTAGALADIASKKQVLEQLFVTAGKEGSRGDAHSRYADKVKKSRNREVGNHFANGMGIHHAGMLRGDRKLTENMFNDGAIKVLVCTATLAWGVNLPAHTVVVKGTEVYNPEKGGITDLSILDVQQIFGRAGRPQFDTSGEATLITSIDAFPRYMDKLVRAVPIESTFIKQLADHLNAEIVGGTVTNIKEAVSWLSYTYLYTRMRRNPIGYGIKPTEQETDPRLLGRCNELITDAAKLLNFNQMITYDVQSGNVSVADRGRVAAHFYIQAETIETFNEMLKVKVGSSDADLCRVICNASEFRNLKVRQEELEELEDLMGSSCPLMLKGAGLDDNGRGLITDSSDKAFVLLQAYISRAKVKSFTLITDTNYISSNASRVARAVFEICLKQHSATNARKLLQIAKSADHRFWWFQTPLRHFEEELGENVFSAIENKSKAKYDTFHDLLDLLDMQPKEVEIFCKWNKQNKGRGGEKIQRLIRVLPHIDVKCEVKPITGQIIRFHVTVNALFDWNPRWHGGSQSFWLWVEDGDSNRILHDESIVLSKRTYKEPLTLDITIPLFGDDPIQYSIRVVSETWVGMDFVFPVPLQGLRTVKDITPVTRLLDLAPLPVSALQNKNYEKLYEEKFQFFNSIQTQLFHVLYHTDTPILLGAPTGSGKTIVAELAILRMKHNDPKSICVYIAPLKSLARERLNEWKKKLGCKPLKWNVLELSGDTNHDQRLMERADILVCTPEKWDLISRGWNSAENSGREFVKRVKLLVMDEVHLLGEDRGAVLEAIVSRTRYISRSMSNENAQTRIIGLSTILANPLDLGDWIGIDVHCHGPRRMRGLYNFDSSIRPVPLKVHVQGYTGRHYCPRMATMNKPCFSAIKQHSPDKPVLIFVASRRQTRLTAFDIISYAAADESPKQFLRCSEDLIESIVDGVRDDALKHTLAFGIGLHHAGLSSSDRQVVEDMYLSGKIQILVATSTLAWGVNTPAYLAIVKGTEYFDGKTSRYVDYPLTDTLQMIGRAGRPGYDNRGVAVVMTMSDKKQFYKKFLHTPFPVESCLSGRMCENLNAEIASGTISSVVEAVGYLTWTFYARRVKANPSFYGANSSSDEDVEAFLVCTVQDCLSSLQEHQCINVDGDDTGANISALPLGHACSSYYLSYKTPKQMQFGVRQARKILTQLVEAEDAGLQTEPSVLSASSTAIRLVPFASTPRIDELMMAWLLYSLASTHEFDELPVRHNEEELNEDLSSRLSWGPDVEKLLGNENAYRNPDIYSDPHTKCFLLMQAHIEKARLPISDYVNDTKTVIENIPRLLAAMRFIATNDADSCGSADLLCQFARTKQLIETRTQATDHPLAQLPGLTPESVSDITRRSKADLSVSRLRSLPRPQVKKLLLSMRGSSAHSLTRSLDALYDIPRLLEAELSISRPENKSTSSKFGKLHVKLQFERSAATKSDSTYTINLLLGTSKGGHLLGESSLRVAKKNTFTLSRDMEFDWGRANAHSEDGGGLLLRLIWEECRGFDSYALVTLR